MVHPVPANRNAFALIPALSAEYLFPHQVMLQKCGGSADFFLPTISHADEFLVRQSQEFQLQHNSKFQLLFELRSSSLEDGFHLHDREPTHHKFSRDHPVWSVYQ